VQVMVRSTLAQKNQVNLERDRVRINLTVQSA
jgi:hypothetical protein